MNLILEFDFCDLLIRVSISFEDQVSPQKREDPPLDVLSPPSISHAVPSCPRQNEDPPQKIGFPRERPVQFLIPSQGADQLVRNFFESISEEISGGGCCLELSEEGVNGTYFLKNKRGAELAVFKPSDEEAGSPRNPKKTLDLFPDIVVEKDRMGIPSGGTCIRELAAYMFDQRKKKGSSLAGVPPTTLINISSKKLHSQQVSHGIGSLQKYMQHDCASWDIGSGVFPFEQVHAIGILDLMILNTDRHGGNILISYDHEHKPRLIPIDHGFCFPENLQDFPSLWFEWLSWPQAKVPFSPEMKSFVLQELDIEEKIDLLKELGLINETCLHLVRESMTLLKKSVAENKTLLEIGHLYCRSCPTQPSVFEQNVLASL